MNRAAELFAQARASDDRHLVLLYSGLPSPEGSQTSYLATGAKEIMEATDFNALKAALTHQNAWFGWLGYELGAEVPSNAPSPIHLPVSWLMRPKRVLRFENDPEPAQDLLPQEILRYARDDIRIVELASNFSKASYLRAVEATLEEILRGHFYQANITRKFYGRFATPPDPLALFERLCAVSPAPYSAFIRCGDIYILSSSPERFVRADANGLVTVEPIKGSAPRGATEEQDATLKARLAASAKDRAENLMIVDLMRNDLSQVCLPGSVTVDALYAIRSYATIHQMVSTVSGRLRPECRPVDAVEACFPPGSMTGAPKRAAIRWCSAQERVARGIYSGAIGYFGEDGGCDLSVVIRTLILQGDRFEFQVGGGIVADSDPESEWQETLVKARGIAGALNLTSEHLAII